MHLHSSILSCARGQHQCSASVLEQGFRAANEQLDLCHSGLLSLGSGAVAVTAVLAGNRLWVGAFPCVLRNAACCSAAHIAVRQAAFYSAVRLTAFYSTGNVGDCRAILCCASGYKILTRDHRCDDPSEAARIVAAVRRAATRGNNKATMMH